MVSNELRESIKNANKNPHRIGLLFKAIKASSKEGISRKELTGSLSGISAPLLSNVLVYMGTGKPTPPTRKTLEKRILAKCEESINFDLSYQENFLKEEIKEQGKEVSQKKTVGIEINENNEEGNNPLPSSP